MPVTVTKTTKQSEVCDENYCQNQGRCSVNLQTKRKECYCKADWIGDQCQLRKNKGLDADVNSKFFVSLFVMPRINVNVVV